MKPIQKALSGDINNDENILINEEMFKALQAFYMAFNTKNFKMMQENWLNSEEIAMDNPLGGIKRGWEEIKTIYQRIFSGRANVYVEFYDYTIIAIEGGFCAIGRERGHVEVDNEKLELAIRTSRVYKWVNNTFQQVHHHGSIEDPKLLDQYQKLVK